MTLYFNYKKFMVHHLKTFGHQYKHYEINKVTSNCVLGGTTIFFRSRVEPRSYWFYKNLRLFF